MVFNNNNFNYSEESDYENKVSSIKEIVLRHIRKISDLSCKEFTGGYWEKKPIKTSGGTMFTEEYHEDVRAAYCNSVDFLIDVLYPLGDSTFKTHIDSNEKVDEVIEIEKKIIIKRKTFKEINKMFERTNFFQSSDSTEE